MESNSKGDWIDKMWVVDGELVPKVEAIVEVGETMDNGSNTVEENKKAWKNQVWKTNRILLFKPWKISFTQCLYL